MNFLILGKTYERPIFQLDFCSLSRLREVTWAGANPEDYERMTKCRAMAKRLNIPKIGGFRLQYLSMKLKKDSVTAPILPIYDSDSSSDRTSGSSGDYNDFTEEEPDSPNSSSDSSRTIDYTTPQSDLEANSP